MPCFPAIFFLRRSETNCRQNRRQTSIFSISPPSRIDICLHIESINYKMLNRLICVKNNDNEIFLDSQMPRLFSLHFHIFRILHFHIFCVLHFHIFCILHFHKFCILHFHTFCILHFHIFTSSEFSSQDYNDRITKPYPQSY